MQFVPSFISIDRGPLKADRPSLLAVHTILFLQCPLETNELIWPFFTVAIIYLGLNCMDDPTTAQLLPTKGFVSYLKYLTNSSPIFVKKDIGLFKIINKTKTELSFSWTKNWTKMGWALRLSIDWDSIQRLYNYKKKGLGSNYIQ